MRLYTFFIMNNTCPLRTIFKSAACSFGIGVNIDAPYYEGLSGRVIYDFKIPMCLKYSFWFGRAQ